MSGGEIVDRLLSVLAALRVQGLPDKLAQLDQLIQRGDDQRPITTATVLLDALTNRRT